MSERRTNPSGLPTQARADELSVTPGPEVPGAAGSRPPATPEGVGPVVLPDTATARSAVVRPDPPAPWAGSVAPAPSGSIMLPDTDAARRSAFGAGETAPGDGSFPVQPYGDRAPVRPGPLNDSSTLARPTSPGLPELSDDGIEVEPPPAPRPSDPDTEAPFDAASVAYPGAAVKAPEWPKTGAFPSVPAPGARPAAEPAPPSAKGFTSRRERRRHETGAIDLPTDPAGTSGPAPSPWARADSRTPAGTTPARRKGRRAAGPATGNIEVLGDAGSPAGLPDRVRAVVGALPPRLRTASWRRVLAAVVVAAGLVLLAVGGLKATVWSPSDVVSGTLGAPSQQFVTTEVGALAVAGTRVRVTASGDGPVFIGVGRAADVDAYLGDAVTTRITGVDPGDSTLISTTTGSDTAAVADPASVDVWTASDIGTGSADLTWPDPGSGQWRLVIASDGDQVAPQDISFTWTGNRPANPAPVYLVVGIVLLVAGVVGSMLLRGRDGENGGRDTGNDAGRPRSGRRARDRRPA